MRKGENCNHYRNTFGARAGVSWNQPMAESQHGVTSLKPMVERTRAELTVNIEVKGVGYRIRREDYVNDKQQKGSRLIFDVGTSDSLPFELPKWVTASVDPSGTKRVLKPNDMKPQSELYEAMGNLTHKILRLRPRSPYTGNGILLTGKAYAPLKSTKTSKK